MVMLRKWEEDLASDANAFLDAIKRMLVRTVVRQVNNIRAPRYVVSSYCLEEQRPFLVHAHFNKLRGQGG